MKNNFTTMTPLVFFKHVAYEIHLFLGRVISRKGDIRWSSRSCDLSPLDYFLWGFLKSKVYAKNPQTLNDLQQAIAACINEITCDTLAKVVKNWEFRMKN